MFDAKSISQVQVQVYVILNARPVFFPAYFYACFLSKRGENGERKGSKGIVRFFLEICG